MTTRYVALIRGVNNIGTGRRIAMANLRALFEDLGFRGVCTVLNSGNVIFSASNRGRGEVMASLGRELDSKLGLTSPVALLAAQEIAAVVRNNPFSDVATNPSQLLIMVPRTRRDRGRLRPLLKQQWTPEALALGSRVAYLWCANGVAKSPLWAAVDHALDRSGTVRNIATFTRIMALVRR